jgi:hypothetical protein
MRTSFRVRGSLGLVIALAIVSLAGCSGAGSGDENTHSRAEKALSESDSTGIEKGPRDRDKPPQNPESSELQQIMRALKEAKTAEDYSAALARFEEYRKTHPAQAKPVVEDPLKERLRSWDPLVAWWPYRPLLRANWWPKGKAEEVLFATSRKGGRGGKPGGSDVAEVQILYQYPPSTVEKNHYFSLMESGAWEIEVMYVPPGSPPRDPATPGQPVVVKGHPAEMRMFRAGDNSNVDWRVVEWMDPLENGASLSWRVANHPDVYTDEETMEFLGRLDEVR